jgi:hypothetical protein
MTPTREVYWNVGHFCMTMMEDGLNSCATDSQVKVLDIAELLEDPNDTCLWQLKY